MKIVFATNNNHKFIEVAKILNSNFELLALKDIGCFEEIPEEQDTLEGNALEKARFVAKNFKCNVFADDTGLEVDSLNGNPGVFSARYAGEEKDATKNMLKLLKDLEPFKNRDARFRTVIALILNNKEHIFEGISEGRIIKEQKGEEGFGYDPIFIPKGYTQTFAQLSLMEKNKISHRALAIQELSNFLKKYY